MLGRESPIGKPSKGKRTLHDFEMTGIISHFKMTFAFLAEPTKQPPPPPHIAAAVAVDNGGQRVSCWQR
jgi:hypothetical protein